MEQPLAIVRALADETRLRALLALDQGELCLCELIEILDLAPSTISRHMSLLERAGLIARRKQGRWQYFRLAGSRAPALVRKALRWVLEGLRATPSAAVLAVRVGRVRKQDKEKLCRRYRGGSARASGTSARPKEVPHGS